MWLYHCFSLSLRDVETILAARGIVVSYESIREWGLRFGRLFANALKRRRPRPGDKWHLDEVFVRIRGKLHYLWRAVDQHGHVLDILVQSRRNAGRPSGSSASCWGLAIRAPGDRDRQAAQLRRGETRDPARRRASAEPLSQQPGRGVAPADATTRAADATVQVSAPCAALPLRPQSDPQPLPAPPSSPHRHRTPCRSRPRLSHLARSRPGLLPRRELDVRSGQPSILALNLTTPRRSVRLLGNGLAQRMRGGGAPACAEDTGCDPLNSLASPRRARGASATCRAGRTVRPRDR